MHQIYTASLLLITLALATTAEAQSVGACPGDDGFSAAGCGTPTTATNLPAFPSFTAQSALYCCIRNCGVVTSYTATVDTIHTTFLWDFAFINIVVIATSPGGPEWNGWVTGKYARTWAEPVAGSATARQVWRFLINGELMSTAGLTPCPIPPHPAGDPTHFSGHIDYACETDSSGLPQYSMALSLHHLPGCISHHDLSEYPYATGSTERHADRSYHLVSPGANFQCQPGPIPQGGLVGESVRSSQLSPTYSPVGEGQVTSGNISISSAGCLCVPSAVGPFATRNQTITGTVDCSSTFANFDGISPLPAPLPPTGFSTTAVGTWTGQPGTFPGDRDLLIHFGAFQYSDPSNPFVTSSIYHLVEGVTTTGHAGQPFTPSGPIPTFNTWMDLGDMLLLDGLLGPLTLGWGGQYYSQIVWNLNLQ